METTALGWADIDELARALALVIREGHSLRTVHHIYGVPRGGVYAAQSLLRHLANMRLVEDPAAATVIVDDIVDTGATRVCFQRKFPNTPFFALVMKGAFPGWVSFPWERMLLEVGPEENVRRTLEFIGEDPNREGLRDTPSRVVRSYSELFSGYGQDPRSLLKTFEDGACDEMVVLRDCEFYSTCEHHLLPFSGKAHLGYIPDRRVVGISKLARLLEVFTRRLQIQERIGQQVTQMMMEELKPKGAACILQAQHFCMTCRGIGKQNSVMVTSSLRGVFRSELCVRDEFLRIAGM